jgi:endonuclease YncB( thermonuclease family)
LTKGQEVICQGDSRDDYGRLLAVCTTAAGEINAALVRQGLAWHL